MWASTCVFRRETNLKLIFAIESILKTRLQKSRHQAQNFLTHSHTMESTVKIQKYPKVFLFGDSLTQQSFSPEGCWGALLADKLTRRCDIVSRGYSGYNVRFCKVMLPALLDKQTASETVALTIFLGANDSNTKDLNLQQHVPLEEYRQGLKEMVEFVMSQGVSREKIILITPPAVYEPDWIQDCKDNGKTSALENKVTATYAKACLDVATEMGTKKVDIYSEMMKESDFQKYLRDGLHLNKKGSELLFSLLWPIVEDLTSHIPELFFPRWETIKLDDVSGSLLNF